ncbi:hypothetical protein ALC62_01184 [Cyphomyrmex costatus]|uniref:Gag-Pol polyprotein n=1 Tax=Cyphomyrmex costatus TaxID=456900 RepID=A0A151IPF1_9HYME|nr:hypothetical protein ALC62_01184 [Cyphomyrmex costatus]
MALRVEVSHDAATHYRASPAPERSLFPDLAYHPPKKTPRTLGIVAAGRGKRFEAVWTGPSASSTATVADAATVTPASLVKYWNCDNGTEFVNKMLRDFALENGIKHTTVSPYHPQANPVERRETLLPDLVSAKRAHRSRERTPKRQRSSTARSAVRGCWNCGENGHRYSGCPRPRAEDFCFGCGRAGVTLRTCPRCKEDWKDLGPYHPDKGHMRRT